MRHRPLPFVALLNSLQPDAQLARKNDAMKQLFRCEGLQLFFEALNNIEARHRHLLSFPGQAERNAGALDAIDEFRALLSNLYPKELPYEPESDEEFEVADLYESPFDLPPSQASPVSES